MITYNVYQIYSPFTKVILFKQHNNSAKESVIYPYFADKENEFERNEITCLSLPHYWVTESLSYFNINTFSNSLSLQPIIL